MSSLLCILLLCVGMVAVQASPMPDVAFFREFPPSRSSAHGPEIRYPLRINTRSPLCRAIVATASPRRAQPVAQRGVLGYLIFVPRNVCPKR
ncbi:unnamed protein product [Spirodela intermedia]|uniref:Uncharacterized protein n=1 Tax=Spirodela intermedia TaxID=51605 RepID=A0A7I8KD18_SPIIN|nr:unnamed protein product [Spirodela intermedia]